MKIKKFHGQGNHLIIDGHSSEKLDDVNQIKKLLIKLTNRRQILKCRGGSF